MRHQTLAVLRRAAAAAALAFVPLLAAPAHAASLVLHDATGDMWVIEEGSTDPDPAPGATVGDFVRTTLSHREHRVAVASTFVDLKPTVRSFRLWVEMRGPRGRVTYLRVQATRRNPAGTTRMFTNRVLDVACHIRHRIDYDANTVRVSFPRRCLGSPSSLQFRVSSERSLRNIHFAHLDNPHNEQAGNTTWTARVQRG